MCVCVCVRARTCARVRAHAHPQGDLKRQKHKESFITSRITVSSTRTHHTVGTRSPRWCWLHLWPPAPPQAAHAQEGCRWQSAEIHRKKRLSDAGGVGCIPCRQLLLRQLTHRRNVDGSLRRATVSCWLRQGITHPSYSEEEARMNACMHTLMHVNSH